MDNGQMQAKLGRMEEIIRPLGRVAVAFSAGVDSTFVLKVAADVLGADNVVAVTGQSESLAAAELKQAEELVAAMGVEHVVMHTQEMQDPNYRANPSDRCYYCKNELFALLDHFIAERGLNAILSGANADDVGDWRPGMIAGDEHQVVNPALEAGLRKDEIRRLSEEMGLPTWDKPAMPCLSSRVAYGVEITAEILGQIEEAEAYLRSLGLRDLRCRVHEGGLARIEVPTECIAELMSSPLREQIERRLREIGFRLVTMDLGGLRSGSLNELVQIGQRPGQRGG